jgi:hypothetical protein
MEVITVPGENLASVWTVIVHLDTKPPGSGSPASLKVPLNIWRFHQILRLKNSFNLIYKSRLLIKPHDIRTDFKLLLIPLLLVSELQIPFHEIIFNGPPFLRSIFAEKAWHKKLGSACGATANKTFCGARPSFFSSKNKI